MRIQLKNWETITLNLTRLKEDEKRENNSFDLQTDNYFSDKEEEDHLFGVIFKLTIKDKNFDLFVETVFHFELMDEKLTDEFKNSSFPIINAPAIAFPYLRAFISNITLQAGTLPIILPSINFVELAKQNSTTE